MRQITCIHKDNRPDPFERIQQVGGEGFLYLTNEAIRRIDNGEEFYVVVGGRRTMVEVYKREGKKYLKTKADNYEPNNLLSLPECR